MEKAQDFYNEKGELVTHEFTVTVDMDKAMLERERERIKMYLEVINIPQMITHIIQENSKAKTKESLKNAAVFYATIVTIFLLAMLASYLNRHQ